MNEKENPFSDDYLRKLQEQFSESKRKEEGSVDETENIAR